ncbi:MAG: hypothetical protein K9J12_10505 [Melioribacteraceae bacterium]|nr:hypothetical protein [Melioribacteraceae bacterium]MCF8264759.1 hypothetical protein [Melioribacteraceae bacterium]MCF8432807.1 hypothetical protein [Melioribacteraceae bacterium]
MKNLIILFGIILVTAFSGCSKEPASNVKDALENEIKPPNEFIFADDLLALDSHSQLEKIFGMENLSISEEWFEEGTVKKSQSKIYPNTKNEISITWKENEKDIKSISFSSIDSKWKLKNGLFVGMSLEDLEKINDKSISFYGFGWDQGGLIDFNEGVLASQRLQVYLSFPEDGWENLMGDRKFQANSKKAESAELRIGEIKLFPTE